MSRGVKYGSAVIDELINANMKDIYKDYARVILAGTFTVENWTSYSNISDLEVERYPNAKVAREIVQSPLFKALK